MTKFAYQLAAEAMASLEMYERAYSSGPGNQNHRTDVVSILRASGQRLQGGGAQDGSAADGKFLMLFADAVEKAGQAGPYDPQG